MRILVTAASKHGATGEIAQAIATALGAEGITAEARAITDVATLEGYDAVVLGSAVYVGKWMSEAKEFVALHADELRKRPVWLFSSGPLGVTPKPMEDPVDVAPMLEATGAREHRLLVGALDRAKLGVGERIIVRAVRAPYGDFRDPATIREWAHHIAEALVAPAAPA